MFLELWRFQNPIHSEPRSLVQFVHLLCETKSVMWDVSPQIVTSLEGRWLLEQFQIDECELKAMVRDEIGGARWFRQILLCITTNTCLSPQCARKLCTPMAYVSISTSLSHLTDTCGLKLNHLILSAGNKNKTSPWFSQALSFIGQSFFSWSPPQQ